MNAISRNDKDEVETLMKQGVRLNPNDGCEWKNGISPLHAAIYKRDIDLVKLLIEYKAEINTYSLYESPLHSAVKESSIIREFEHIRITKRKKISLRINC